MLQTFFARLGHGLQHLVGSRFFTAFSGLSFTAFLAHVLNAPTRFPPIAPLSPTLWGLAPPPPQLLDLSADQEARLNNVVHSAMPYAPGALHWLFAQFTRIFFAGDVNAATAFLNVVALVIWSVLLCCSVYMLARQKTEADRQAA